MNHHRLHDATSALALLVALQAACGLDGDASATAPAQPAAAVETPLTPPAVGTPLTLELLTTDTGGRAVTWPTCGASGDVLWVPTLKEGWTAPEIWDEDAVVPLEVHRFAPGEPPRLVTEACLIAGDLGSDPMIVLPGGHPVLDWQYTRDAMVAVGAPEYPPRVGTLVPRPTSDAPFPEAVFALHAVLDGSATCGPCTVLLRHTEHDDPGFDVLRLCGRQPR